MQTNAVILDCSFVYKDWIQNNKDTSEIARLLYGCNAKVLNYGIKNDNVTEVIGTHLKGSTNRNVKLLNIDKQPYSKIPKRIVQFFPNLVALFVQDSKIENVTKYDLKPFQNIKYLSLCGNTIKWIEQDLFDFTPNIIYINFGWNLIQHVGTDILKPLKHLTTISFYRNVCIGDEIWKGTPGQIELLTKELKRKCKPSAWMLDREEQRSKPNTRREDKPKWRRVKKYFDRKQV